MSTDIPSPDIFGPDILGDLEWRGLIAQSTDREALRRDLAGGVLTLY